MKYITPFVRKVIAVLSVIEILERQIAKKLV
jgi:hypothetical protein